MVSFRISMWISATTKWADELLYATLNLDRKVRIHDFTDYDS